MLFKIAWKLLTLLTLAVPFLFALLIGVLIIRKEGIQVVKILSSMLVLAPFVIGLIFGAAKKTSLLKSEVEQEKFAINDFVKFYANYFGKVGAYISLQIFNFAIMNLVLGFGICQAVKNKYVWNYPIYLTLTETIKIYFSTLAIALVKPDIHNRLYSTNYQPIEKDNNDIFS